MKLIPKKNLKKSKIKKTVTNIINRFSINDIDNGLLLTGSLHDTFDKHYWCIDPINLTVVLNKSKIGNKNLTCCEYENKKIRITPNNKLLHNLQKRYNIFMDPQLQ